MPNDTANRLEISGPKSDRLAVEKFMRSSGKEKRAFDFQRIIPRPNAFDDIIHGVTTINGERYASWRTVDGKDVPVPEAELTELKTKYGSDNWYDWSVNNWGTKWNAYDVGKWKHGAKSSSLYFETAWSPPFPVMEALSEKFPSLRFTLKFADEGGGFLGLASFENGKKSSETEVEWDSEAGKDLRRELRRYYEHEDGEE